MELVPGLEERLAKTWFPTDGVSFNDYGNSHRRKIISAVIDIESGISETPLYKALL